MIPEMMGRWWHAHRGGCGGGFGHGHGHGHGFGPMHGGGGGDDGSAFGVRRPLRFLAHRLQLDDRQAAELARILDEIKTERAQVAVDDRRAVSGFADAISGEALDAAKLGEAAASRVRSAERLRDAVVNALGRLHALLDVEQRAQLAFLIRTGVVQF
jgi:predicted alpha-1,6-mannanase (GH76 family)